MRKILAVDDEPAVLELLVMILTKANWDVTAASSGRQALKLLAERDFHTILCDLDLGAGPSGLDLIEQMPPRNKNARFVMLTGKGTVGRCRDSFLTGADDYLEKPIYPAALVAALEPKDNGHGRTVPPGEETGAVIGTASAGLRHVRAAMRAIELSYMKRDLDMAAIAKAVGTSTGHLRNLFHDHVGHTVVEHLHDIRITEARRFLIGTDLSVYEIARNCGYDNTGDLDRHFFHRAGCSPTEFRRREREQSA
jgi:YesN/AraC family two-component response regulator